MPHNDTPTHQSAERVVPLTAAAPAAVPRTRNSIFSLPPPVKRIFDKFPLREYESNELPLRAPSGKRREKHRLHVFATEEEAQEGRPSCNPGCLKWQTYLHFNGVDFTLVSSNNHASPSGSLPFLQPATVHDATFSPDPVPVNKLRKWVSSQQYDPPQSAKTNDVRAEVYQSLIEGRIRKSWLYQLYLAPQNDALMQRLYVQPCSRNTLVRFAITRQLRAAAEAELVKSAGSNVVDAAVLMVEAEEAFDALADLLGQQEWFFGEKTPGLFDASLFAFTQLILDEGLGWQYNPLEEALVKHKNLVGHRWRILESFFGDDGPEMTARDHRPSIHVRTTSALGKRKSLKG